MSTTNVPSKLRSCESKLCKLCRTAVLMFHIRPGDCNIFTCNKHYALLGQIAKLLNYVTQTFICSALSI